MRVNKDKKMELFDSAEWWAVGTGSWGKILTYEPCATREEAESFVSYKLHGRGLIMTRKGLLENIPGVSDIA